MLSEPRHCESAKHKREIASATPRNDKKECTLLNTYKKREVRCEGKR